MIKADEMQIYIKMWDAKSKKLKFVKRNGKLLTIEDSTTLEMSNISDILPQGSQVFITDNVYQVRPEDELEISA